MVFGIFKASSGKGYSGYSFGTFFSILGIFITGLGKIFIKKILNILVATSTSIYKNDHLVVGPMNNTETLAELSQNCLCKSVFCSPCYFYKFS